MDGLAPTDMFHVQINALTLNPASVSGELVLFKIHVMDLSKFHLPVGFFSLLHFV